MFDLVIVGIGPAGLTASIYALRFRINHLLIGKDLGGAMALASQVENYPGFGRISGLELAQKMADQIKSLGGEILTDEVVEIRSGSSSFSVLTAGEKEFQAKNIIVATGTRRRELGVPGEKEFLGRGVSYCPTCDAPFFRDKTVAVVGGANAAVMGALHLADFAKKVFLIHRRNFLRAEPIWVERIEQNDKIEKILETEIKEILGKEKVEQIALTSPYKGSSLLEVDGVFIEIGGVPGVDLVVPLGAEVDQRGFIKVGSDMATNIPGIFAAGDVASASGELRQIITAAAEGAIAATSVYRRLQGKTY